MDKARRTVALFMGTLMSLATVFGNYTITSDAAETDNQRLPDNSVYNAEADNQRLPGNPVYNAETDTATWDYVYFGSYPQTELTGGAVTEAIQNAEYDRYGDAQVDGERYRRVRAGGANYSSALTAEGFYDWYGKDYVYFKYEPVRWRVLENDGETLFLMADSVLDCRRYCANDGNVTWETSYVRQWLNGYGSFASDKNSFLKTAFTDVEQSAIVTTTVDKSDNLLHKTGGGNAAEDKIFFLSIRESIEEKYGFSPDFMEYSSTRRLKPTDYAHAMGIWMGTYNEQYGDNCWWLLRSTGSHTKAVSMVYPFGNVYQDGYYADTPYYGTCPALKVDVDSDAWTMEISQTEGLWAAEALSSMERKLLGDADADNEVTLEDALMVLKAVLKITGNSDALTGCDVNGDSQLTLEDAKLILEYALKILGQFPVEQEPQVTKEPDTDVEPTASETPVTTVLPMMSESPVISIAPKASKVPARPSVPPAASTVPKPSESEGPLVQEKHDATGVIWIAADSIAVSYNSDEEMGLCGWGEVIGEYFNDDVVIENMAKGGRSSKSFIQESNYKMIRNSMAAGDYLLISFGHNDERAAVELYTNPYGASSTERSYKWYLKEYYIDPAIKAGVQPVLISPVARRYFYNGKFINPQLHSPYATAMQELVEEYAARGINIYYIDLHNKMLNLYEELGEEGTYRLHAKNDTTHLCRAGIDIVCDYLVEEMKRQNMNIIQFLE